MITAENPFQVLGTSDSRMIGRTAIYNSIVSSLSKPTPDHISIVGPEMYGKTIILRHLAANFENPAYVAVVYWDLGHQTPENDEEFKSRFSTILRAALEDNDAPESVFLEDDFSNDTGGDLKDVFQELHARERRVLTIMDGFDRVFTRANITRSLWDYLRSIGSLTSLRFVIGSRRPLVELCRTEDARTSDFWNIFPALTRVKLLEEEDISAFVSTMQEQGYEVLPDAVDTVEQYTGGIPVLTTALCKQLIDSIPLGQQITTSDVKSAAAALFDIYESVLSALWNGIDTDMQVALGESAYEGSGLHPNSLDFEQKRDLEDRGIIHRTSSGRLQIRSRILRDYAKRQSQGVSDIHRLFVTPDSFENNISRVLELRMRQFQSVDVRLKHVVERMIDDLRHDPDAMLLSARDLRDRALDLIWDKELGSGRRAIPGRWKTARPDRNSPIFADVFPENRGQQCALLRDITGSQLSARPFARYASKPTSILIDQISSAGDFRNHRSSDAMEGYGFLVAVCITAVELCGALTADLNREPA